MVQGSSGFGGEGTRREREYGTGDEGGDTYNGHPGNPASPGDVVDHGEDVVGFVPEPGWRRFGKRRINFGGLSVGR